MVKIMNLIEMAKQKTSKKTIRIILIILILPFKLGGKDYEDSTWMVC